RAAVVVLRHVTNAGLRIDQVQYPALEHIGGRCTHRITYRATRSVECAWAGSEVLSWIEFNGSPYMGEVCSQISRRREEVRRDLPLDADVPRVLDGRFHVRRYRQIGSIWNKHRILLIEVIRERIATRVCCPRIVEVNAGIYDRSSERRYRGSVLMQRRI